MAYERVNWENLPSTNTPVNADNLNKLTEGLSSNDFTDDEKTKLENLNSNLQNYSFDEQIIGSWTNGKPLYRKTIDCGNLPNNSTNTISTNLTNIIPRKLYGFCYSSNYGNGFAINTYRVDNTAYSISAYFDNNNIKISTTSDRSSYYAYVTLEYTKPTD